MTSTALPRVTVALPVFNGERYLAEALDSILAQDFEDFELLIGDNGSTDSTLEICRTYADKDDRITLLRSDRNRGAAWNYNRLLEAARGELFKWVAHDDVYAPQYLGACVGALDADPSAVLAHSRTRQIDGDGRFLRDIDEDFRLDDPRPHVRFRQMLVYEGGCYHVFGVIHTDVLRRTEAIGPFAESDRVLLAELAIHGGFAEVPQALFSHREHGDRSIYRYPARSLAAWFDPRRAQTIGLPVWRLLWEILRAVHRSGLPPAERWRCYAEVRHWVGDNWVRLLRNLPGAGLEWLRRRGVQLRAAASGAEGTR